MKRFYKEAGAAPVAGGWQVTLDGRGIKTAGGRPQLVPTEAAVTLLAREWAEQGEDIDASRFVLRDLADYALDVVAGDRADVIATLLRYAETDTLCYRAEAGEPLEARQIEAWEPLLKAAEARWDIQFERIGGVIHCPQPAATLKRLEAVVQVETDFTLAALNTLTTLAASLVIGLAALAPDADAGALWDIANLEEDWQAELWGKEQEYLDHRARRLRTFAAAMEFVRAVRG
ncbi:ATP12 family chaperone protein [Novosphingobium sp.]|uniref:ATP12 family chaperone protein n=1 Tax=Novosphingobium sp. TaxID=1874826 RepID=UPI00273686AB|nr:ATP12 family protein [Novosphingobium sp.]MDP3905813.1 ATP12 family protein [Novosphingobium sp.]